MIGRLNHVAIAVSDLALAMKIYRELIAPLGESSPISNFLARNPQGGIHHVCYEVSDIRAARDRLLEGGARVLGDGEPQIGAHGKPVLFLHPKDFCGTLIEIEQA
jgi:methylmalonyl-CoA/ethylmalonyl-CoA epimerase